MRCSIVDAVSLGKASISQNIIRYLGYFVSMFSLFTGFFWIAFDRRKQGWHDKIAGTVVIMGRPKVLVSRGQKDEGVIEKSGPEINS